MSRRFPGFDADRDRADTNRSAELFEYLWPNRNARMALARRLARSIRIAHRHAAGGWEVTMFDWGVRLNVGQVCVLWIESDAVAAYVRLSRGKSEYAAVRVPSRLRRHHPAKIAAISSNEWRAHDRFIAAAAEAKKGSPWRKSFSEGILKYLESMLHIKLPRPTYLKSTLLQLHILQGGIQNGDKKWLERAAKNGLRSTSWIAPKSANVGDEAVIYITTYGFFATARVDSQPKRRTNWVRRYGAALSHITLIEPPISLGAIRAGIPSLKWAKYPRSIATLKAKLSDRVRQLIDNRRDTDFLELADSALPTANLAELRRLAILSAKSIARKSRTVSSNRQRSQRIHYYVLRRANGYCEGCRSAAPFLKSNGEPYFEPHHTRRLADD